MSPEALALGALSSVRAVPMAIVYALLLADRPRRLVAAYIASGLMVSLVVGLAAVVIFEAEAGSREQTTGRSLLGLGLGILAVAWAVAYGGGWVGGRSVGGNPLDGSGLLGRIGERLRRPTAPVVAAAGAVTNLPGLYYLAGLVAILGTQPTVVGGAAQILVFTVLRLGGPIAVLMLLILRPDTTVTTVQRLQASAVRHRRVLVGVIAGVVGVYLIVRSAVELA